MDIGEIEKIGDREIPVYKPGQLPITTPAPQPEKVVEPSKTPEKEKVPA